MAPETRGARRGLAVTGEPVTSIGSAQTGIFRQKGIFRKEGEYWTIGYGGKPFRLKDTRGLGYIAHLLRNPAVEFHVLDLVGGIAGQHDDEPGKSAHGLPRGEEDLEKAGIHIAGLGDAGEMLDDQAKVAYRRRLSELREELDEAKTNGNVERAERAEQEIEALTKELSRAVGLGGRNRRAASASERARQTITHSIKSVLDRIGQSDRALANLFSRAIKTGTFCSYQPDPDFPVAWEFAARLAEPAQQPRLVASVEPAASRADRPSAPAAVLEVSPFSFAERTAFVGREAELGAIRAVIDRALEGQGSIVMLSGGPGLGKSPLAMAMAEYATRGGFRCLVGHCCERDEPFIAILGERSHADELYALARELVGTGAVALWPMFRTTNTIAGIAAASAGQWEAADDHFQTAMRDAESFPVRLEQAEIRRFHAMMLLKRAAPGDRKKARSGLDEAREIYAQTGMPRHVEMIQTLLR